LISDVKSLNALRASKQSQVVGARHRLVHQVPEIDGIPAWLKELEISILATTTAPLYVKLSEG